MLTASPPQAIESSQALAVAHADALRAYRDLTPFRIELVLESDGWHVDYRLKNPEAVGGGPFYVIDATTGEIVSRKYYQ
ncbi:MAG: hypothetical protein ACRC7O_17170 [Fimbriiglobus sp.]